ALGAVARQVVPLELFGEIGLFEALRITPDRADHRRPRTAHHQESALAALDLFAGLVDDGGIDARQRQRAGTRLERRHARQRRDHVRAGFGLPPGVDHRATLAADVVVIPDPGLWV